MNYKNPNHVDSPADYVGKVNVIYDEGEDGVSIAEVEWDGVPELAIRWNVARREWDDQDKVNLIKDCVGMPSSHGYPVWFILPKSLFDTSSELRKHLDFHFKNKSNSIE